MNNKNLFFFQLCFCIYEAGQFFSEPLDISFKTSCFTQTDMECLVSEKDLEPNKDFVRCMVPEWATNDTLLTIAPSLYYF